MTDPEQAIATQLRNIEAKTSRTLEELCAEMLGSGAVKHGELRSFAMEAFDLGYGDANSLAHNALKTKGASATPTADSTTLAQIYPPEKAHLRAIHDALLIAVSPWGAYELAPKKSYVAFRRKKQFAMLGPKTRERSELGINIKDEVGSDKVVKQKPGGMCQYVVSLARPEDIDQEVLTVLRQAFDAAG
jgi:predicted transport protein